MGFSMKSLNKSVPPSPATAHSPHSFTGDVNGQTSMTTSLPTPPKRSHRYEAEALAAIATFKQTLKETEAEGWQSLADMKGIAITQKQVPGTPTGCLKGVGFCPTASPIEMLAVIISVEARKIWDPLFEMGRLVETLDPSVPVTLNYATTKAKFPTTSRDLVLVSYLEYAEDGSIYIAMKSVVDDRLPVYKDKVRMRADLVGWHLAPSPRGEGTHLTYVAQTDPCGWIPSSLLKMIATQVPLCVAGVINFAETRGVPPIATRIGGELVGYSLEFSSDQISSWTGEFRIVGPASVWGPTDIYFCPRTFTRGVTLSTNMGNDLSYEWLASENKLRVTQKVESGTLRVTARKSNADSFTITIDGRQIFPTPSPSSSAASPAPSSSSFSVATAASSSSASLRSQPQPAPVKHRLSSEVAQAVADFKAVYQESLTSTLWEKVKVQKGISISRRPVPGHPIGYVKGVGLIRGFSPDEVLASIEPIHCRQQWDDMVANGRMVEPLDERSNLIYVEMKSMLMVSARDLLVMQTVERTEEGNVWLVGRSIEDSKCPEVSGKVRSDLQLGGWFLERVTEGPGQISTRATHILLTEPKGWIPQSVLSMLSSQMPMKVSTLENFVTTAGPPPSLTSPPGVPIRLPEFDLKTNKFTAVARLVANRKGVLHVPLKRYPNGYDVTISPPNALQVFQYASSGDLLLSTAPDAQDVEATIQVLSRSHPESDNRPRVNGQRIESVGDNGQPMATSSPSSSQTIVSTDDLRQLEAEHRRLSQQLVDLQRQLQTSQPKQATRTLQQRSSWHESFEVFLLPLLCFFIGLLFSSLLLRTSRHSEL